MAASVGMGSNGGGSRRRRSRRHGAIADINMTPFIDVMLVLLIIFMVSAPLLTAGVPLDLPQTSAKPLNIDKQPITISVDEKGAIFLMDKPVEEGALVETLRAVVKAGLDDRIYVRGHKRVDYGRIAQVMSLVTTAGYKKVALVTEPDPKG
jgi:biopolymer transport protein TolR